MDFSEDHTAFLPVGMVDLASIDRWINVRLWEALKPP
jgi:hypothetical protein